MTKYIYEFKGYFDKKFAALILTTLQNSSKRNFEKEIIDKIYLVQLLVSLNDWELINEYKLAKSLL